MCQMGCGGAPDRRRRWFSALVVAAAAGSWGCVPEVTVSGSAPAAGPPPRIIYFEAEPPVLLPGGEVTLRWRAEHASAATISHVGAVAPTGTAAVVVDQPRDYLLTVRDGSGRQATEVLEFQPPHVLSGKLPPGSVPPGLDRNKYYLFRPGTRRLVLPQRIRPELLRQ